jgi:hypothetical protein
MAASGVGRRYAISSVTPDETIAVRTTAIKIFIFQRSGIGSCRNSTVLPFVVLRMTLERGYQTGDLSMTEKSRWILSRLSHNRTARRCEFDPDCQLRQRVFSNV